MVKSRKATVKAARPLPNLYSVEKLPGSSSSVATPASHLFHNSLTNGAGTNGTNPGSNRSLQSATTSKRPIFHHLTRLQHGILRYRNVAESPTSVASNLQQAIEHKDRKFVYVPEDYMQSILPQQQQQQHQNAHQLQNQQCLTEILQALNLPHTLPPLLVITAATDGAVEESMDNDLDYNMNSVRDFHIKPASLTTSMAAADNDDTVGDLTEEEERDLLREKTHEILSSTVDLCGQLGAWVVPHRPRRANGAAEILCGVIAATSSSSTKAVTEETSAKHTSNDTTTISNNQKPVVVLGLIGLDQQDRKEGFQDLVISHAVPVGTSIPKVCEITFDPTVRDHLPCPELTHLLIFQKRRDMRAFRDQVLLQQIPDVLLAFGKTTNYAQKTLCSSLIRQSPVALITHTSKEIDHLSWMLKHCDREMRKIQVGAVDAPPTAICHGEDGTTYRTLPIPSLKELEEFEPELSDFVTSQWPVAHDDERVVLADPRKVGGMQFQQEFLRAINAAYYTEQARTDAIQEAQLVLSSMQVTCRQQNKITEQWHLAMVSTTLSAVVAAVLYAKIYASAPPPSLENRNPYQIVTFLVTLVIPMLILWSKKRYDASSQKWSTLQKESATLESSLAEFRTRPRSYTGAQSSSSNPVEADPVGAFVEVVLDVQARVADLMTGGSNESVVEMKDAIPSTAIDVDVEAPPPPPVSESSPLLPDSDKASPELMNGDVNASPLDASMPTKANVPPPTIPGESSKRSTLAEIATKWKKLVPADTTEDDDTKFRHYDSMSNLDLDDIERGVEAKEEEDNSTEPLLWTTKYYIAHRISTERERKQTELRVLSQRHKMMETIITMIVSSTTLFALLSKQWFIPIVLGISSAFVASQDFRKYQKRLEQGQDMIRALDELLVWWDSLTVEEKILNANQDQLVHKAERIIAVDIAFTY